MNSLIIGPFPVKAINLRNSFNLMNRVPSIAKRSQRLKQLDALHQQIVRVGGRYRKNAYARGGQRRHERSKYTDFRQIKWPVNFHNAPTHFGSKPLRNQSRLCNDRQFIAGPRNRKELPLRGPLRHKSIRSKTTDSERFRQQGKFKTTLGAKD